MLGPRACVPRAVRGYPVARGRQEHFPADATLLPASRGGKAEQGPKRCAGAQLELIHGTGQAAVPEGPDRGKVVSAHKSSSGPRETVPYAHPYYWAPFVLLGNWQ